MIKQFLTVHQEYVSKRLLQRVYEYDPTDDGPECEVITRILGADWYYEIDQERNRWWL